MLHAGFPSSAQPHVHSLLCVSAAAGQLRSLAGTLQNNHYNVYASALPSDTSLWSAEDLSAAAELLLQRPADSADGNDGTEPDVIVNEISAIEGDLQTPYATPCSRLMRRSPSCLQCPVLLAMA